MRMKTLSAALLAAGVTVVGTAGAFDLTPSWFKHGQPAATHVAAAESTTVPPAPVQQTYAPNYRAIVKQAAPAVVGVSVAGMHAVTNEEQGALPPGMEDD